MNRTKKQQLEFLHSNTPTTSGTSGQVISLDDDHETSTAGSSSKTNDPKLTSNGTGYLHDIDDEDDDDPDINFEVRPEKLSHKPEEHLKPPKVSEEEELARSASNNNLLKAATIYSNNKMSKTPVSDTLAKLAASSSPTNSLSSSIINNNENPSPNQKGIRKGNS